MIRFVTFGIIVDDIVFPSGETRMGVIGGGGVQTAWGIAAALGGGAEVGLVAGIGADEHILAPLRAAGIDLAGVRITDLPTPRAWQLLEPDGRRVQVWRVPGEVLGRQLARHAEVLPPTYRQARGFHWGIHPGEGTWLAFAQTLRDQGRRVSLEPFRPPESPMADPGIQAMLAACDVFSPNWAEAAGITGSADDDAVLDRFRTCGGRILALRRGAAGADVWDLPAGRGVHVPAVPAPLVDAVGAGNAFCGALLARLDDGLAEAACHASAAASYMVEQVGIPAGLPDPTDYARRLDLARAGLRPLTR